MSNNLFNQRPRNGQWISPAKRGKIIDDYIRSRDEWRRSVEKMRRIRDEFIRRGLMSPDEKAPEK